MVIYLDLVLLLNFAYDFLILLTVSLTLKRKVKLYRCILSAMVGALSIFLLFLKINSIILFLLKVFISYLMCIIAFRYISIRYTLSNLFYLYLTSIILAGFLYLLNIEFAYKQVGMIFVNKGLSINYLFLIIISPIILFLYYLSNKQLKNTYNDYYKLTIVFDNFKIECISLYDNGNNLVDPITLKGVIIVNGNLLKKIYNIRSPMYVPYKTIGESSIIKCFKPSYIILNNKKIYNYLIGESKINFTDGVDAILNKKLKEDNYV